VGVMRVGIYRTVNIFRTRRIGAYRTIIAVHVIKHNASQTYVNSERYYVETIGMDGVEQ
jgi:hypothetical protein